MAIEKDRAASDGRGRIHARGGERKGCGPRSPTRTSLGEGPPALPPSRDRERRGRIHARGGEREGGGPRSPTPTSLREGPPALPPSRDRERRFGAPGSPGAPTRPFLPGHERERDGPRTRWSRSHRGRDARTADRDGLSTLPHQRCTAREGRLGERDGPRASRPTRPEGEQRVGERDGPRAPPPTEGARIERDRRAGERDGPPAPPTAHSDTETERLRRERDGLRPPSPLKPRAAGGLPPTTDQLHQALRALASPHSPRRVSASGFTGHLFAPPAPVTNLLMLPADLIHHILSRLHPVELCRAAASCRELFHILRANAQAQAMRTFIGTVLVSWRHLYLVTMKRQQLVAPIVRSVNYARDSLWHAPSLEVVDSRNGYLVLKLNENFRIWNPLLRRNGWIVLPSCNVNNPSDMYVASALVRGVSPGQYILVGLYLGPPAFVDSSTERCLVVKIYRSYTDKWEKGNTGLHFRVDTILHPYSVSADDRLYFLDQMDKKLLEINHDEKSADWIDVPEYCTKNKTVIMMSRAGGHLCLCSADIKAKNGRQFMNVFQYVCGHWEKIWIHEIPQVGHMTKLLGFAEENGLLIVSTSTEDIRMLDIQTGAWVPLQDIKVEKRCFALEARTAFRHPFIPGPMDIDDHKFECIEN